MTLKENIQFNNFPFEVEARWKLVETAWSLNISPALLEVKHDDEGLLLFVENDSLKRINITINGRARWITPMIHPKIPLL